MKIRLNKMIALCRVGSRHQADQWIREGLVKVNGKTVKELATWVDSTQDRVHVKGKQARVLSQKIYLMMNKPKRCLTTLKDPKDRLTVKDFLPKKVASKVFPIGRLDWHSEGLLLFTNDGVLAHQILSPQIKTEKVYLIKVAGHPSETKLQKLQKGIYIPRGGKVHLKAIYPMAQKGSHYVWFRVLLTEGKYRQLHQMFAKMGHDILKLKRVAIGQLKLAKLKSGEVKWLTGKEIQKALLPTRYKKRRSQTKRFVNGS